MEQEGRREAAQQYQMDSHIALASIHPVTLYWPSMQPMQTANRLKRTLLSMQQCQNKRAAQKYYECIQQGHYSGWCQHI